MVMAFTVLFIVLGATILIGVAGYLIDRGAAPHEQAGEARR